VEIIVGTIHELSLPEFGVYAHLITTRCLVCFKESNLPLWTKTDSRAALAGLLNVAEGKQENAKSI